MQICVRWMAMFSILGWMQVCSCSFDARHWQGVGQGQFCCQSRRELRSQLIQTSHFQRKLQLLWSFSYFRFKTHQWLSLVTKLSASGKQFLIQTNTQEHIHSLTNIYGVNTIHHALLLMPGTQQGCKGRRPLPGPVHDGGWPAAYSRFYSLQREIICQWC